MATSRNMFSKCTFQTDHMPLAAVHFAAAPCVLDQFISFCPLAAFSAIGTGVGAGCFLVRSIPVTLDPLFIFQDRSSVFEKIRRVNALSLRPCGLDLNHVFTFFSRQTSTSEILS